MLRSNTHVQTILNFSTIEGKASPSDFSCKSGSCNYVDAQNGMGEVAYF